MKKAVLILIFAGLYFQVTAPPPGIISIPQSDPVNPYEYLWVATCIVESNNKPHAVGDLHLSTHSYGIVQIRQSRLSDFNRSRAKHYTLPDMFDVTKSKEVWMWSASRYAPDDIVSISRSWNGWTAQSLAYVEKIKSKLYFP